MSRTCQRSTFYEDFFLIDINLIQQWFCRDVFILLLSILKFQKQQMEEKVFDVPINALLGYIVTATSEGMK